MADEGGFDGANDFEGGFLRDVFFEEVVFHPGERGVEVGFGEDFSADEVTEEGECAGAGGGFGGGGGEDGVDFLAEVFEDEFPTGGLFAPFFLVDKLDWCAAGVVAVAFGLRGVVEDNVAGLVGVAVGIPFAELLARLFAGARGGEVVVVRIAAALASAATFSANENGALARSW